MSRYSQNCPKCCCLFVVTSIILTRYLTDEIESLSYNAIKSRRVFTLVLFIIKRMIICVILFHFWNASLYIVFGCNWLYAVEEMLLNICFWKVIHKKFSCFFRFVFEKSFKNIILIVLLFIVINIVMIAVFFLFWQNLF